MTTRILRTKYWALLRASSQEFTKLTKGTEYGSQADFAHYMKINYGIAPVIFDGHYTDSYTVVDDRRFLLTKIKYDI